MRCAIETLGCRRISLPSCDRRCCPKRALPENRRHLVSIQLPGRHGPDRRPLPLRTGPGPIRTPIACPPMWAIRRVGPLLPCGLLEASRMSAPPWCGTIVRCRTSTSLARSFQAPDHCRIVFFLCSRCLCRACQWCAARCDSVRRCFHALASRGCVVGSDSRPHTLPGSCCTRLFCCIHPACNALEEETSGLFRLLTLLTTGRSTLGGEGLVRPLGQREAYNRPPALPSQPTSSLPCLAGTCRRLRPAARPAALVRPRRRGLRIYRKPSLLGTEPARLAAGTGKSDGPRRNTWSVASQSYYAEFNGSGWRTPLPRVAAQGRCLHTLLWGITGSMRPLPWRPPESDRQTDRQPVRDQAVTKEQIGDSLQGSRPPPMPGFLPGSRIAVHAR